MKNEYSAAACRFKVNDKIVCIDCSDIPKGKYSRTPRHGEILVIRGLDTSSTGEWENDDCDSAPGVYLVGIKGWICSDGSEASWNPWRFISLEEYKRNCRLRPPPPLKLKFCKRDPERSKK